LQGDVVLVFVVRKKLSKILFKKKIFDIEILETVSATVRHKAKKLYKELKN
jgi:hypothetical protein